MKNKKYGIILIFLLLLLTTSSINTDKNRDPLIAKDKINLSSNPMQPVLLKVGTAEGPGDLDPQYAWDSASIDTIDQVFDGLFY